MSTRWTEDTTLKFVENYIIYECLWNYKSSAYRNKQIKQNAVSLIVDAMKINGFGAKEVNQKIKSIRSTYSQELRKIKASTRSGAGSSEIYKPNLKWFPLLDEALKSVNINETVTQDNMETSDDNRNTVNENTASINSTEVISNNTRQLLGQDSSSTRKRRLQDLNSLVDKVTNASKQVNSTTTVGEHEFDLFSRSVGAQLKSLPLVLALQAQKFIQNYLSNLRIESLSDDLSASNYAQLPSTSPTLMQRRSLANNLRRSQSPHTVFISSPSPSIVSPSRYVSRSQSNDENIVLSPTIDNPTSPGHNITIYTDTQEHNYTLESYPSSGDDIFTSAIDSITEN